MSDAGDIDVQARLRPQRRLTIGVTGHRPDRLGAGNLAAVAAATDAVLAAIEHAAQPPAPDALRLVTSLAEGADEIGADGALTRGWRLDVVLPFDRDDYAADFAADARHRYRRLLDACASVMELPGDRAEPEGAGIAYERAGRIVLAQSDILVAIVDGGPARGRGGAPQMVAEAVLQGIPVIQIDSAGRSEPILLWDGLEELDLGQQTVETVARGDLGALPDLVRGLVAIGAQPEAATPLERFAARRRSHVTLAIAYPLLLGIMGVRRLRLGDVRPVAVPPVAEMLAAVPCSSDGAFARRIRDVLAPRFAYADAAASRFAQLFRSVYVTNFAFAALAVLFSMLSLALPAAAKPVLILLELGTIATILVQTRAGTRAAWHRLWLDNRAIAERLRCLGISAQLGDLELRAGGDHAADWAVGYTRATARELGLPSARIDATYLGCVRDDLMRLIDDQVAYLASDAHRMHRLEHRLHLLGTILFALSALTCVGLLAFKMLDAFDHRLEPLVHMVSIGSTMISATLPAIGAAIYGIRMQGDFAGTAERNHTLGDQLARLRAVIAEDALSFDTLGRRVKRVTGLLTEDLSAWLQTYHARPLALPG